MADIHKYFDEIDLGRSARAKELSEIKRLFSYMSDSDPAIVASKATVVLCYAAWEGFYNDCLDAYLGFLREVRRRVRDVDWTMLLGAVTRDLNSLKDRHHSDRARLEFMKILEMRLECEFDSVEASAIRGRSILNYDTLRHNYEILNFSLTPWQMHRNRLDLELGKV